jgi:RimJ/RimL family protein N-acetyltransferase
MIVANTLQLRKTKVYRYAVILSETDIMVGVISVTMLTKDRTGADIGYWLGKKYWGMGLMTEALSLATERVFFDLGVKYLSAWTYDANSGSKKVLEKCGFTLCKVYKDRYIIEGKSHDRLEYILNACDSKVTQKAENES